MNRTLNHQSLPWYKTLKQYYKRDEWELFDLKFDPNEVQNLADDATMKKIRTQLEAQLMQWQIETNDPWRCAPHAILQDKGEFKDSPQCLTLGV